MFEIQLKTECFMKSSHQISFNTSHVTDALIDALCYVISLVSPITYKSEIEQERERETNFFAKQESDPC